MQVNSALNRRKKRRSLGKNNIQMQSNISSTRRGKKKNFGKTYMGIVRTTFVFDEKGTLVRRIDKVQSKAAAQQILEVN